MSSGVAAAVCLLAVLVVGAAAAWRLVPWRDAPLRPLEETVLPAAQEDRAKAMHAELRGAQRTGIAVGLALPVVLGLTPLGASIVHRLPGPGPVRLAEVVLLVSAVPWLLALPVGRRTRGVLVRYGLSTQPLRSWWRDRFVGLGLSVVLTAAVLAVTLPLMRGRWWWAWLALVFVPTFVVLSVLAPPVVERMFARFTPMAAGPVREAVLDLAGRAEVSVRAVLVADASRRTTALNAYVSGLGPTRRVVVYDTLLGSAPQDELASVLAHELSHARSRDVLAGGALSLLGGLAAIAAGGVLLAGGPFRALTGAHHLGGLDTVPLLLALVTVVSFVSAPASTYVSRRVEQRADRVALELTADPAAFVAVHRRLALTNLADPHPSRVRRWWFGSHPTAAQRLATAAAYRPTPAPDADQATT